MYFTQCLLELYKQPGSNCYSVKFKRICVDFPITIVQVMFMDKNTNAQIVTLMHNVFFMIHEIKLRN